MAYAARTLVQTAERVGAALRSSSDPFVPIRDFVDDYRRTRPAERGRLMADEPPLTGDSRFDAYIAAMAEHFSGEDAATPPAWVDRPERFLDRVWFREPRQGFWPMALVQTPPAFRRRFVFIEESEFDRV